MLSITILKALNRAGGPVKRFRAMRATTAFISSPPPIKTHMLEALLPLSFPSVHSVMFWSVPAGPLLALLLIKALSNFIFLRRQLISE